jgi:hypothetical protein
MSKDFFVEDTFAEKISLLLQENWDSVGTDLDADDVFWSHDKYETMTSLEQVSQKAIISTYNPTTPVTVENLSSQTNLVHETVVIDVILHTEILGGTDAAISIREAARKQIMQVIHQNATLLPGAALMRIEGEYVRGELPQIQREAFKVVVSNFEVLPQ